MSTTPPFIGSPTVEERLHSEVLAFKSAMRSLSYELRVGLPGIIKAFDATTQLVSVQLTLREKLNVNGTIVNTTIDQLDDVLLLLPGDSQWCITFPNLIGCECFVCFADMCISAWWQSGEVSNQLKTRRHDLSDGFAILAPRSQPKAITNYSTTDLQIRSMDGTVAISLDSLKATIKAPALAITGPITVPSVTAESLSLPVTINGVVMYLKLSTSP